MAKKKPVVTGDCSTCGFRKGMMNPAKGKKLPVKFGGKCTRCEGFCEAVQAEAEKETCPKCGDWKVAGYPSGDRQCLSCDHWWKKEKGASRKKAPERKAPRDPLSSPGSEVKLSLIYPNPDQPRKIFDAAKLEELAQSIKEQGLIEPLVVVERVKFDAGPKGNLIPRFMLVAGERRWRACQIAGLQEVPVRIIEADDNQIAEMALVENIQREDLTPLEEAKAFNENLFRLQAGPL